MPPELADIILQVRKLVASRALKTHCRRELFQGVWVTLLDDGFVEVYVHGIVVEFWDGVKRRVYLRIITYSADYPEK